MNVDGDRVVITAPLDCEAGNDTGSANFYKIDWHDKYLALRQKVVSTNPSCLFGFSCKIFGDMAFVGDGCRDVGNVSFAGGLQAYEYDYNNVTYPWQATQFITDVIPISYNQFGSGGLDFDGTYLMVGQGRASGANIPFLPIFYPPNGFPPSAEGRVLTFIRRRI
jgi:hypothetical protein